VVLSGPLRRHCANDSSAKLESCSSQQRNFHGYKVPSEYTENHSSVLHTSKGRFGAQIQSGCTLLRHLGKPVDFLHNFWFPGNQSTLYSNLPSIILHLLLSVPIGNTLGITLGTSGKKSVLPHCMFSCLIGCMQIIFLKIFVTIFGLN